ncbi:PDZ domain-containing protein [bacterium]|nr:PDZ domain-containing protein [candidate division CSSED10-310 bacterium]
MARSSGYYLEPDVRADKIVFISDDDLWQVGIGGGIPVRLTSNQGITANPFISPDGRHVAFTGREEGGPEVFVLELETGNFRRLTHTGGLITKVVGWDPAGDQVLFITSASEPFISNTVFHRIHRDGGVPRKLDCGWGSSISFGPSGGVVIGRFGRDPAQWKRYRGGRMGEIWIDLKGSGRFQKLLDIESNITHPLWIKDRIYFMGDHEGYGNLYSCRPDGSGITRHTDHQEFYVRNPRTDQTHIAYHAGGDIYLFDIRSGTSRRVEIDFRSPRRQRQRKFVDAERHLESYDLHPQAHSLALTARGKPVTFALWEGAVRQHGIGEGPVRYRLARWLHGGKKLAVISDENGEEALEIHSADIGKTPRRLKDIDIGRPILMETSPVKDEVILTNQRQELIWIDIASGTGKILDRSLWHRIDGFAWSPDGEWVAYSFGISRRRSAIKLCKISTGKSELITEPVLHDIQPSFDPEGKYLYFLSHRIFDPVTDNMAFDYGFPKGVIPMLVTLQSDTVSPFIPTPRGPGEEPAGVGDPGKKSSGSGKAARIKIDLKDIQNRIVAFPVPEGRYSDIAGAGTRVFFMDSPVEGTLSRSWLDSVPGAKNILKVYDFEKQNLETFVTEISDYRLSRSGKTLAYQSGSKLRVIKAGIKPEKDQDKPDPGRETGWIDLNRIKISIEPQLEWRQMFRETWRLLRDQYFIEDMAGVKWDRIHDRYVPLVDRVSTRFELSDLLWELGGELGTSHCYEIGGDYRRPPVYPTGLLGVDWEWDRAAREYRITHIVRGDSWDDKRNSPFNQPGMKVEAGDRLTAVNGRPLDEMNPPGKYLVGLGGKEVSITVRKAGGRTRDVTVRALNSEQPARLMEWINRMTQYVHDKSNGRIGYIYMQDMGSTGFSQFHRAFLSEVEREGLIIDVRHNAGGHVSSRLLQKLSRKRVGWEITRYNQVVPSPGDAVDGPMAALCDEFSGSDGDIFAHHFKQLKLGLLIGRHTWGGVVGLNPTHPLVDGTVTTQPEFFNYYDDVGWMLENRGAEPDIEVEFPPQDAAKNRDPQLDRAIREIMKQLKTRKRRIPKPQERPSRQHPDWPPVTRPKKS